MYTHGTSIYTLHHVYTFGQVQLSTLNYMYTLDKYKSLLTTSVLCLVRDKYKSRGISMRPCHQIIKCDGSYWLVCACAWFYEYI